MSQSLSPLAEEPIVNSAPPEPPQDRKRAYTFCGSSFGVVRLENLREIANLKADLVACYRPVNSQEMFAIERMAIAQQLIVRAARLDAGLFTSALNDVLDRSNNPILPMDIDMVGDGDIEITRAQNRNYCIAEGFRRIAKESNLMTLALRYRVQAERDYRRALEEFQRLERLRPKLPNEPDLLIHPDAEDDIARLSEINRWVPDAPAANDAPAAETSPTEPSSVPPATAPLGDVSRPFSSLQETTPNPQETTRPYIQEAGQPVIGPQASFKKTRAAGAGPQLTSLGNVSSNALAAHRSFAFPADVFSTRPRARAPRVNNPSAAMRTDRLKNSEPATPVSAKTCRRNFSCGCGSSSGSTPPARPPSS